MMSSWSSLRAATLPSGSPPAESRRYNRSGGSRIARIRRAWPARSTGTATPSTGRPSTTPVTTAGAVVRPLTAAAGIRSADVASDWPGGSAVLTT